MKYIILLVLAFLSINSKAQIVFESGSFIFRLDEAGYSINGGPSIEWAEYRNLNLVMGGTKTVRESQWTLNKEGILCLAVRYKFSQFQMFGIARTNRQTLVNFCPTYIAMSKKFGFAPLVVPLINDKDVSFTPIERASPFKYLSQLGLSYTCVHHSEDKGSCKLYGPGLSNEKKFDEWLVQ